METIYEGLTNELKFKLGLKKIEFDEMFRLINNQKYEEIKKTRYPLYCAKENETLKCFLIKIK